MLLGAVVEPGKPAAVTAFLPAFLAPDSNPSAVLVTTDLAATAAVDGRL